MAQWHDGFARAQRGPGNCDAVGLHPGLLRASHVPRGACHVSRPGHGADARRRGRCGVARRGEALGCQGAAVRAPACVRAHACTCVRMRAHARSPRHTPRRGVCMASVPATRDHPTALAFCCRSCGARAVTSVLCPGVGITFEPDLHYGSPTNGMHIITKIRPNSPADKSELPPEPAGGEGSLPPACALEPPCTRAARAQALRDPFCAICVPTVSRAGARGCAWSARRALAAEKAHTSGWWE